MSISSKVARVKEWSRGEVVEKVGENELGWKRVGLLIEMKI